MEPNFTFTRRPLRSRQLLVALALPAMAAVGCSSDDVAERISEAGLGEGSDVSIDSESGDVSVKTEDGEITSSSGGNTKLPEAWPSEIPMPEDYKLTTAMSMGTAPDLSFNLAGEVDDAVAAFDDVTAAFVEQGWTEVQKATGDYGQGATSSSSYEKDGLAVGFGTMSMPDEGVNTFNYTVTTTSN